MQRIVFCIFLLIGIIVKTQGQEVLTGLSENAVVKKAAKQQRMQPDKSRGTQQLELPFLDDFTRPGVFPDDSLWQDRNVYINNSYCYKPFSIGVATFDALNDTGTVYAHAQTTSFPADTLTSQEIRLDSIPSSNKALSPADSLYLSFYIQPQGIGNPPQESDSLLLKFYAPGQQKWVHMWGMAGNDLQTFYDSNLVYKKRIMIPVTDTMFFHKDFKMRFMNYASVSNNNIPSWVSGNIDIWNLDFVHMDIQRTHNDTSLMDWMLTSQAHSLLNNYEQMPWDQFKAAPLPEMNDTFRINYRSNRGHRKDVNMTFRIIDLSGLSSPYNTHPSPITNQKMPSFSTFEFEHVFDYVYPSNTQKYNDFELLFHISVPDDPRNSNDTSRFYQRFYNYYAYDDGTAEAGYGLSTNGAELAYQFTLNKDDTLQSVQMYFNHVKNKANIHPFTLTVWEDNNGKPGNVIYEQPGMSPEIEGLNKFHTYELDKPQAVSGTFYVGWQQSSSDNLNIGYDKNNNAQDHIFYNTFGQWNQTIYEGALMIRPILGDDKQAHVGIEDSKKDPTGSVEIYPNPIKSGERLRLKTPQSRNHLRCSLYNLQGRLIKRYDTATPLIMPALDNGMYLLHIQNQESGASSMKKIIIIN
ncbi:MAG: T9SS type A sorting domain-containing protein [Bacteroidales bacterium]